MFFKTAAPSPALKAIGPASMGMPVIDTNTLRQAALQNSWQRDQRVARRRLAVRWVLWWLWQYRYSVLALCAVLAAYLVYRAYPTEQTAAPEPTPASLEVPASPAAPTGPANPAPSAAPSGVRLRIQPQLLGPTPGSAKQGAVPTDTPTPFQLRPATQLNIKETKQ